MSVTEAIVSSKRKLAPKLTGFKLVGCQSHEDTTTDLSPGLNVIIARNNTGKSVFLKILKVAGCPTYYNTDELKSLVRHGHDFALGIYMFDDGSAAAVRILANGSVAYFYSDDYENEDMIATTTPSEEMIYNLSLIVDNSEKFIANILDLDQNLVLVNSNSKSNASLIKLVTHNERLTSLIENTKIKIAKFKEATKPVIDTIIDIQYQIDQHSHTNTDALAAKVSALEIGISVFEKLLDGYTLVESYTPVKPLEYEKLISLCDFYQKSAELLPNLTVRRAIDTELLGICDTFVDLSNGYKQMVSLPPVIKELPHQTIDNLYAAFEQAELLKPRGAQVPYEAFSHIVDGYALALDGLCPIVSVERVDISDSLISLIDLQSSLLSLGTLKKSSVAALETAHILQLKINAYSKIVPCVIYGEVIHVGGECIPVSN